jgi:nucleotide-binding universal stress UspA family protein
MGTIICATDFSETAKKATNWAAFLAAKLKMNLHLYNCYHIPVVVNDIPFPIGSELEIEDGLNGLMNEERKRLLGNNKDLLISTKVEPGFSNESIIEYAKNQQANLIVMGIAGRNPAGQLLIGSTAVHVALHSKIPILIIPSQAKSIKIVNMAVACDFAGAEKISSAEIFHSIATEFDVNLDLVHVTKTAGSTQVKFSPIADIENYKYSVHSVEDESVEPGLVHFTERNNVDVLAIIHKQHGFFERIFKRSHTGKLAYKINIPLLVLHE